jgi:topoisomerase-4 subunit B
LEARLLEEVAKIGEKIDVVHYELVEGENIVPYIHAGNRMGVLVEMNNAATDANISAGKDVAMQIAAMNPVAVDQDEVDASTVEREMKIGREQAIAEGKPENIIDRIAEGKLQKFFKENTLLNQDFVKDSSMSVAKMLDGVEKGLTIKQFNRFKPARLFKSIRSKAYLFSGVEIRWKSEIDDGITPTEATFHFPGGLADYLRETLNGATTYSENPFAGVVDFNERFQTPGKVEWAINWTPSRDGFIQSYCNTVPTPEGGTHESGFWAAILKGIRAYGERINNRKAKDITREDLITGGCALVSCFIREPEFVGQTKDRLATNEAARLVENSVRDHFDNWLAADTKSAGAILDFLVLRAEERMRRRQEKETARKSATKKLRLPGKLTDCTAKNREGTELFIVEGDSAGGSAKGARNRENQALLPLKGKILNVLGAASNKLGQNAEINDLCEALGVGMGTRFNLDDLRYDKIIIMTDADVDGAHIASLLMTFFYTQMRPLIDNGHLFLACPPLYRLTQGAKRLYVSTDLEKDTYLTKGIGGKGKIDVQRFKGLGEMDAKDLKETTMDPKTRKLIRVTIDEDEPGETTDLVERLMGKKPELRFQYIQENARFVEELDV